MKVSRGNSSDPVSVIKSKNHKWVWACCKPTYWQLHREPEDTPPTPIWRNCKKLDVAWVEMGVAQSVWEVNPKFLSPQQSSHQNFVVLHKYVVKFCDFLWYVTPTAKPPLEQKRKVNNLLFCGPWHTCSKLSDDVLTRSEVMDFLMICYAHKYFL